MASPRRRQRGNESGGVMERKNSIELTPAEARFVLNYMPYGDRDRDGLIEAYTFPAWHKKPDKESKRVIRECRSEIKKSHAIQIKLRHLIQSLPPTAEDSSADRKMK